MFPPFHNAFLQVFFGIFGMVLCYSNAKHSKSSIFGSIFIFHLISVSVLASINLTFYNDVLGFDPHDALWYRECGEEYGSKSYPEFFIYLYTTFPTVDDWGYPSMIWALYHVFGDAGGWLLRGMNALVVALGSLWLYKLALKFLDREYSRLIATLWGVLPYSVVVSAGGTKENFFGFVVIGFAYFLYQFKERKNVINALKVIVFIIGVFLFRLANGYAAILCFISVFFINKRYVYKNFKTLLLLALLVSVAVFPVVLATLASQRGFDDEIFTTGNEAKAAEVGGAIGFVVNAISSIIGPIPCFVSSDEDKLQHLTVYSFVPYLKLLGSYFFYYALYIIYKEKKLEFIPMVILVLINILMILVAFFGLHVKFQWPHIPLFLLVSVWGFLEFKKKNASKMPYAIYLAFATILMLFYNIR